MIPRVGVWVSALRIRTLGASIAPVLVGSAVAVRADTFSPLVFASALVGAVAIQAVVNLHNDLSDAQKGADAEDRLGPARAVQNGWLSPRAVMAGIAFALILAFSAGLVLVAVAGWPMVVIGLFSVLCAFLYTGGPWPLAYVGIADLFVIVFFGFVAVLGTVFAHGAALDATMWLLGAALGFSCNTLLVVNNLRDRYSDARAGKKTTAVRFGAVFARLQYTLCWLVSAVAGALAVGPLALFVLLVALPLTTRVWLKDGVALNRLLEQTGQAAFAYALLLVGGLLL